MGLKIDNITYSIADFRILDKVSAEMSAGEAVGLIGPNGAGKTTLANIISGFLLPSSGRVSLNGHALVGRHPAEIGGLGLSRMFQNQHLAWNLSTIENVLLGLDSKSTPSWRGIIFQHSQSDKGEDSKRERAKELLGKVGLIGQEDSPSRDLSFGQQRLLALAMSIAHPSSLLLLDEPFTGLKSAALELVLNVLRAEVKEGRMLLIIDHALSAVRSIVNKIWFMERGRLTSFADFTSMIDSQMFTRSYLGFNKEHTGQLGEVCTDVKHSSETAADTSGQGAPLSMSLSPSSEQTLSCEFESANDQGVSRDPVLTMRAVAGGYGSRIIINEANLDLFRGDVLCVLGLNGSGKSTLLRIIAGTARKFSGSITMGAQVIDDLDTDDRIRNGLRLLPQDHRLFRNLSVRENLLLSAAPVTGRPRLFKGLPLSLGYAYKMVNSVTSEEMLAEIGNFGGRPAGTLSGGEQAKISLMQLEYGSTRVMMLDEPTSGIDAATKTRLTNLILSWKGCGLATIIVEHDTEFVLSVATRIGVLSGGTLQELYSSAHLTPQKLLGIVMNAS